MVGGDGGRDWTAPSSPSSELRVAGPRSSLPALILSGSVVRSGEQSGQVLRTAAARARARLTTHPQPRGPARTSRPSGGDPSSARPGCSGSSWGRVQGGGGGRAGAPHTPPPPSEGRLRGSTGSAGNRECAFPWWTEQGQGQGQGRPGEPYWTNGPPGDAGSPEAALAVRTSKPLARSTAGGSSALPAAPLPALAGGRGQGRLFIAPQPLAHPEENLSLALCL